ncbi:No mechanoreceptor potential A [Strongyloides ratti]|uniref:No mechanoreceptor potential A n=1 Tax=Strongyloides ratti TaxID=34506 RepID=A0A090KR38_STRRB|nr:No mechanoreceptor potential A [Strongyloides ratti]CEF59989.1 No mechanoreceptor potential A [Strongyloides ratti]
MSGKITWLIIIVYLLNVNVIFSQIEDEEDSGSLFNVNTATMDALFSNFEEKNDFDQHESINVQSKKLSTTNLININSSTIVCEELNLTTTLVRYSNLMSRRKTFFNGNIDLLSCSDYCKKGLIPFSYEEKTCAGLNYFKNEKGVNICQLIDKFQIGDLEKSVEDDNMNHWYQKICLNIKNDCKNKLILFDGIPNHKIKNGNIIKEVKLIIERCLELCNSNDDCYGINYIKNDTCQLIALNDFEENEDIERDANFNFYRNECSKSKCLLNSQSFIFYPTTRIQSPKIVTSTISLNECMEKCIHSDIINCRNIQFSRNKNECSMYDFSMLKTMPSQYIDIYKPVCFNIPLNRNCNKQFIYEVIPKTSVNDETNLLYFKIDVNVKQCLQECLNDERCYLITFKKSSKKCVFYGELINPTNFKKMEDFDLYIISCDNKNITENIEKEFTSTTELTIELFPTPTDTLNNFESSFNSNNDNSFKDNLEKNDDTTIKNCSFNPLLKLVEKGKILRQEFRIIHQKDIVNATYCSILCKNSTINCNIFAYSVEDRHCFLSNYLPDNIELIIQDNDRYDIWSLMEGNNCLQNNIDDKTFGKVIDRTPKIFNKNNDNDFLIVDDEKNKVTPKHLIRFENTTIKVTSNPKTTTLLTPFITTTNIKTTTLMSTSIKFDNDINKNLDTILKTKKLFSDINENTKILQFPKKNNLFTKILSNNLKVHVKCHPTGANVTFNVLLKNYTGAVYAIEKFSYCKTIVNYSNVFSIFIPRPRFNNSCNSIEINRQLTAILVMSNDLVIPYDLTTKDDLIYEIKCDYNDNETEEKVFNGSVIGQNDLIIGDEKNIKDNINFKIMRGDKSIDHAFVGEKLKIAFLLDFETNNLNIISCNASKIGETDGKLRSIPLISNGCSLIPQIISNISIGKYGLEAELITFKIDGNNYIDISCNILICHNNCQKNLLCNGNLNNTIYENVSKKSTSDLNKLKIVRKKIHVLVDEEFSNLFNYQLHKQYDDLPITINDTSSTSSLYDFFYDNQCIDIHIFGISITIFLIIIITLIIIISYSKKVERKKYGVVASNTN